MEYYWELRNKNAQNIKALMCPLYREQHIIQTVNSSFKRLVHTALHGTRNTSDFCDKTRRIVTAFGVDHWIDNKPTICNCFNVTFSQGTDQDYINICYDK